MMIRIFARSFFEARRRTSREVLLFQECRIISINDASLTEEPPFRRRFFEHPSLLILRFDDVEGGQSRAMTESDAMKIVRFAKRDAEKSILIHCNAGISRSGSVGEVLNWYFNRHLQRNDRDFEQFVRNHPDLMPNVHVRRTLLEALVKAEGGFPA